MLSSWEIRWKQRVFSPWGKGGKWKKRDSEKNQESAHLVIKCPDELRIQSPYAFQRILKRVQYSPLPTGIVLFRDSPALKIFLSQENNAYTCLTTFVPIRVSCPPPAQTPGLHSPEVTAVQDLRKSVTEFSMQMCKQPCAIHSIPAPHPDSSPVTREGPGVPPVNSG